MPQELISQFDRKIGMPIETFRQVQTINLRNAIPTNIRWEGMIVYVVSESLSYVLVGGTSNSQWVDLGTLVNVTVRDNLTSTSSTDALSANQGRILKDMIDNMDLSAYQLRSEKGSANGYAPLDSGVKVPLANLPDSLIGNVKYQGTYNPATNTPTLANPPASSTKGDYYVCTADGTRFGIDFRTGDWIISDGTQWDKVDNTDAVTTVFGRIGNVVANAGDYTFAQIGSKPTTIAGYGITDFNSLGDARWVGISNNQTITGVKTIRRDSASTTIGDNPGLILQNDNSSAFNVKSEIHFNGPVGNVNTIISSDYTSFASSPNRWGGELNFYTKLATDANPIRRLKIGNANIQAFRSIEISGEGNPTLNLKSNQTGNNQLGLVRFLDNNDVLKGYIGYPSAINQHLYVRSETGEVRIVTLSSQNIDFYTNNTLRTRIESGGTLTHSGAIVASGNITAPSFKTTNWEIVETGGVLQFKQGGVTRFQMKSTGVIEATNFKLGLV